MNRRSSIGFDRRIDLEWLDAAAAQAAADANAVEIRAYLWKLLDSTGIGEHSLAATTKTVTVLSHIWGEVPETAIGLRRRASALIGVCTHEERTALHWAMMLGTYPVFTDVASAIGRLLLLQGHFTLAHLTRRLVTTWGERSTLSRAVQRIVRSMVQWGVLRDTETRGMYEAIPQRCNVGPAVGLVLIEALLIDAEGSSLPLEQLIGHPALFPFDVDLNASHVRGTSRFRVHRQGLDADFVELQGGST